MNFEYFLQQDKELSDGELHQRDRNIFLALNSAAEKQDLAPRQLLSFWLKARQENRSDDLILPGALARDSYKLIKTATILIALLCGASTGLAYFSYSGSTPVNVLTFFTLFVLFQLLLALLLIFKHTLIPLITRRPPDSMLMQLLSRLSVKLFSALYKKARASTSTETLLELQALTGRGRGFLSVHGRVFYWPLFVLVQISGICFNIGLLASSLGKIAVSDLAFGWQSTLQISADSLYRAVKLIALPWSWFLGEGNGFPSLGDIEGSRIILKEGIAHLTTTNLTSWWPFLLLSVLTYGLIVRVLLYGWGRVRERLSYAGFSPQTPAAMNIVQRMKTPFLTSQAILESGTASPLEVTQSVIPESDIDQGLSPQIALIPDECYDSCDLEQFRTVLAQKGFELSRNHRFQVDYGADQALLTSLADETDGILILMEAWMPPLVDFLEFLKKLRGQSSANRIIRIKLIGPPQGQDIFTPVTDTIQKQVWENKINALGDPYLELSTLL